MAALHDPRQMPQGSLGGGGESQRVVQLLDHLCNTARNPMAASDDAENTPVPNDHMGCSVVGPAQDSIAKKMLC